MDVNHIERRILSLPPAFLRCLEVTPSSPIIPLCYPFKVIHSPKCTRPTCTCTSTCTCSTTTSSFKINVFEGSTFLPDLNFHPLTFIADRVFYDEYSALRTLTLICPTDSFSPTSSAKYYLAAFKQIMSAAQNGSDLFF